MGRSGRSGRSAARPLVGGGAGHDPAGRRPAAAGGPAPGLHDDAVARSGAEVRRRTGGGLSHDERAAIEALPHGLGAARRAARPQRRRPVPARLRPDHRRARTPTATSSSTTSRSPAGTPSSSATARATGCATSAASTAPTSTASASTTPCSTAGDEVQIGKFRMVYHPHVASRPATGRARRTRQVSSAARGHRAPGPDAPDASGRSSAELRPTSPTSRISKIRFLEDRGAGRAGPHRRRATASSPPTDVERLRLRARAPARPLPAAEGDPRAPRPARPRRRPGAARAGRPPGAVPARALGLGGPAAAAARDPAGCAAPSCCRRPASTTRCWRPGDLRPGGVGDGRPSTPTTSRSPAPPATLAAYGIEPRHLRAFRTAADRRSAWSSRSSPRCGASAAPGAGPGRRGRREITASACGCTPPWSRPWSAARLARPGRPCAVACSPSLAAVAPRSRPAPLAGAARRPRSGPQRASARRAVGSPAAVR